ncbi:BolA/IbaG family iron-sulfur metabolism protein [Pseudidiomarina marina]|uniref:BolA family transcriptional regulator n=1 Tax=Pseudidiomarina marina TaxID=502366 RepID=A0A432YKW5_9GAMM|nr:BolA/IbaG family iron-sulfur metabolism protein [Pseudidiomarina marina]RUO61629.1 BolA family transcriptional regulator [Pseudidiomarina marina]
MTTLQEVIQDKLLTEFSPLHLDVINESHLHGTPSDDSHFKVVIVAELFDGMRLLQRHRAINKILRDELAGPVHALALHVYSPVEWHQLHEVPSSPACRGGSKLD